MRRFGTPERSSMLAGALALLISVGTLFFLPVSDYFRHHGLRLGLLASIYLCALYLLSGRPIAKRLRYVTSITSISLITIAFYVLKKDLPILFLLYLFAIIHDSLVWDQRTAAFTTTLSLLGYSAVAFAPSPTVNSLLGLVLIGFIFISTLIISGSLLGQQRLRTKQLVALSAIAQTVSQYLELDAVLSAALDKVLETLEFESGAIYVKDIATGELEMKQHRGLSEEFRRAVAKGIISASVADSGKPFVIDDLSQDPNAPRVVAEEGYRPLASIPLLSKEEIQGVLTIASRQLRRFRQRDVDLLLSIGNQIGVAIENARLYEDGQRRLEELEMLHQVSASIVSTLELDKTLQMIMDSAVKAIPSAQKGSLHLLDEQRNELVMRAGCGFSQEVMEAATFKVGEGYAGWAFAHNQPVIIDNVKTDTRFKPIDLPEVHQEKSAICVPLVVKGKTIGTITLDNITSYGAFDENDLQLLSAFADQAAMAIENARLYEEEQEQRQEAETLRQAAQALSATLNLQQVFESILSELQKVVPYDSASVQLLKGDRLEIIGGHGFPNLDELLGISLSLSGDNPNRQVVATRAPFIVEDAPALYRGFRQEPHAQAGIRAWLGVPLLFGDRLIGMIALDKKVPSFYTEEHARLALAFAAQAAIAIENARLYEEEQRRASQLKIVQEVGERIASILDLNQLLAQTVNLIRDTFGYYYTHVLLVDTERDEIVLKASASAAGKPLEKWRADINEESINGWVARNGEPLLVNDVSKEPRYQLVEDLKDTRSELAVPIKIKGRVIGTLDVQSTKLNAFDEGDLQTLQTLADQLAVAMENARLYEETKRLAITDSLTGLYNLRYFYEALEKEIQRSERYHRSISLIILDLDDFKAYNDLYGHLAGDDLLMELAQLISEVTRQTDTLTRYGGDEFAIILPETETKEARFLAERLQQEVKEHRFSMQDGQIIGRITISLGVATYPHRADSAKALVNAADKALLRAKRAGKNRISVYGEKLTQLEPR